MHAGLPVGAASEPAGRKHSATRFMLLWIALTTANTSGLRMSCHTAGGGVGWGRARIDGRGKGRGSAMLHPWVTSRAGDKKFGPGCSPVAGKPGLLRGAGAGADAWAAPGSRPGKCPARGCCWVHGGQGSTHLAAAVGFNSKARQHHNLECLRQHQAAQRPSQAFMHSAGRSNCTACLCGSDAPPAQHRCCALPGPCRRRRATVQHDEKLCWGGGCTPQGAPEGGCGRAWAAASPGSRAAAV